MQIPEKSGKTTLDELSQALSAVSSDLAGYLTLAEHAVAFRSVAQDLMLPPLVVVMGAFNAGKSTLLNALLGQRLLRMHVLPSTATVTMLRKGNAGEVYGHANGLPIRTWPLSELVVLSAEDNAEAAAIRQSLSYIEVPLDVDLLDKVTLVDTPGLNSPNEAHTRATEDFVHRSGAVLWIVSCLSPLTEQERSWIERLPAGVKVMVVVNQIDQLDPDEDSLSSVIDRIRNNLQRPDLIVTAVSAKLALNSLLKADPNQYAASLWEKFREEFNSKIIYSDTEPQLRRAVGNVAELFRSLNVDLVKRIAEAEGLRIKAEGGNNYHEDLRQRLSALGEAEHRLLYASDAAVAVQTLEIPAAWDIPNKLQMKQEALIGAFLASESEQALLNHEGESFKEKYDRCVSDHRQWLVDVESYKTSGLFGGKPIFFKGKKLGLEIREQRLIERNKALKSEHDTIRARQQSFDARQRRLKSDCSVFSDQIVQAIRSAMASVVKESQNTVEQQKTALRDLDELKWLPRFASQVHQAPYWTLAGRDTSSRPGTSGKSPLDTALETFNITIDRILKEPWGVTVPPPLVEPPQEKKPVVQKSSPSVVRLQSGAIAKSFRVIAALGLLLLFVFVLLRFTPQPVNQQSIVEVQQPKPSVATVAVIPSDDYSAIRANLMAEGYVADGVVADVPGISPEAVLHAQKVSCSESTQPCEKLFIFAGSRAVWSEDLDSTDAFFGVTVTGPGQFDAEVKHQLSDGTEISETVNYKWDGSNLSRTVEAPSDEASDSAETGTGEEALDNVDLGISQALDHWARAMETNDPTLEAQCYAEQVDRYFLKLKVPNVFVRDYMDTWLKENNRRVVTFVPKDITFENETATTAKLRLVKDVVTSDSSGTTERFTRSRLYLKKEYGDWKITSEQDFK